MGVGPRQVLFQFLNNLTLFYSTSVRLSVAFFMQEYFPKYVNNKILPNAPIVESVLSKKLSFGQFDEPFNQFLRLCVSFSIEICQSSSTRVP